MGQHLSAGFPRRALAAPCGSGTHVGLRSVELPPEARHETPRPRVDVAGAAGGRNLRLKHLGGYAEGRRSGTGTELSSARGAEAGGEMQADNPEETHIVSLRRI